MDRTNRNILILGTLAILTVVLAFYFLLLGPLMNRLDEQAQARDDKRAQLPQVQQDVNKLEDVRRNSPEIERQLLELNKRIPDQPQIPTLLVQLEEVSSSPPRVTKLSFDPGTTEPFRGEPSVKQVPIEMDYEGTYDELQTFLGRVDDLARLVTVTDVSFCRVPHLDPEHSCPVQPPEPVEESTAPEPSVEAQIVAEIDAEVYFQPENEPSN